MLTGEKYRRFFCILTLKHLPYIDTIAVSEILHAAESGIYVNAPYDHPAYDANSPAFPLSLKKFADAKAYDIAMARMGHLRGTAIGTLIVLLNSVNGISLQQFAELRKRFLKCPSCLCYFSFDSYQSHIEYTMTCRNTPLMEPGEPPSYTHMLLCSDTLAISIVPDLRGVFTRLPSIPVTSYPAGVIPLTDEAINTPIGVAWLTWNSRAGVTHDNWVQMITAWRRCPRGCGMVRSFSAHAFHMQEKCPCSEVGDAVLGFYPPLAEEES